MKEEIREIMLNVTKDIVYLNHLNYLRHLCVNKRINRQTSNI